MTDQPSVAPALRQFQITAEDTGRRIDQYLTAALANVSRARVQEMIEQGKVQVDGGPVRASFKLRGHERIEILGAAERPPVKATAEDIPLDVVYEDEWLAVINKPAGMVVHAGAGDEERNRGTLVNALLHRFQNLSALGGETRPGIVHRLDKETSGLIVVAKNDEIHRKLAAQFASRQVSKRYLALVIGWPADKGTISAEVSRDRLRPTRMTTRRSGGRAAVSHFRVIRRIQSEFGKCALLEVHIETGRTHQIRVHLASAHHPVVGDTLYGAPKILRSTLSKAPAGKSTRLAGQGDARDLILGRNFLHATVLEFVHPATRERMRFERPLPPELVKFLNQLDISAGP